MLALTKKERIIIFTLAGTLILGASISAYQRYADARFLQKLEKSYSAQDAKYADFRAAVSGDEISSAPAKAASDSLKLDVNKASAKELEALPKIGPVLAQRIVDYRTEKGPFKTVDELVGVKGIGVKTLERIRPYIFVR